MATVLVSFIGTGVYKTTERSGVSKTGYELVEYVFPDDSKEKTTVFGSALIKYLKKKPQTIDTWLIMGTPQSIWCDLVGMFGDKEDEIIESTDEIFEVWNTLKDEAVNDYKNETKDSKISQENLDDWQKVLSDNLVDTKVICRLVGDATEPDSQDKIFNSLLEVINDRDNIVFDVTHGLRNQPIITSFVVMYLRYLKQINADDIKFYYGGKDLDGKVFELDFCNQLLKATEAVAIYEQTGNYEQIGKNLKMPESFDQKLERLVFLDEVNKTNSEIPTQINNAIESSSFTRLQQSLLPRFKKPLYWASKKTLSEQLQHKALTAYERKQYYKAVLILVEAVIVAYGETCGISEIAENLETHRARELAEKEMIGEWNNSKKMYIGGVLDGNERQVILNLKKLRNAIAHGTDANGVEIEAVEAREAIENENKLRQIFHNGNNLFARIIKGEIGR